MISAVEGLVGELRRVGVPVSAADYVDAVSGLRFVDLGSRGDVKAALGSALIKDASQLSAFSVVFDLYFSSSPSSAPSATGADASDMGASGAGIGFAGGGVGYGDTSVAGASSGGGEARGVLGRLADDALRAVILAALEADQGTLLRALASEVVTRFAGIRPGRSVAGTYYLSRAMRAIGADSLVARLLADAAAADPSLRFASRDPNGGRQRLGIEVDGANWGNTGAEAGNFDPKAAPRSGRLGQMGAELDDLGRLLLAEEYERRVSGFQREVEAEIRRRMVADRGADDVARTLRAPLPEDAEFLTASGAQLAELRGIVGPLARKLAARLASRQRRHRRGALDFRRTARGSMSAGGVPMVPVFRRPRPAKPELVILADISGSVSAFAEFTLHLTYALRTEFTKVRSFVFVDTVGEVTEILADAADIAAATAEINARGCGVWLDGHSDYGNALRVFAERHGQLLRKRTTVLVLGDARANYHASGAAYLKEMARRAGHVFWLNPEPAGAWNSGDSVIGEYARYCDAVVECRNVRQLRAFVERLVLLRKQEDQEDRHLWISSS